MNEEEFAEVVRRHRPELLGYARRIARTDAAAEDAVQQALLQAWIALQRDGVIVRDLRPWLFRIVHNATVTGLRRPRFEPLDDATALSMPADAEFESRQQVRETFAGLAALPELQRNVMLSTAVDGRSHEQIAAAYGLTKDAVRGLIYRARASLRAAAAAVTPAPVVAWVARQRVGAGHGHGASAGEALVGASAGSAGVAGVLKSSAIVLGIAASTGGVGYAVLEHHAPSLTLRQAALSAGHRRPLDRDTEARDPAPQPSAVAAAHRTVVAAAAHRTPVAAAPHPTPLAAARSLPVAHVAHPSVGEPSSRDGGGSGDRSGHAGTAAGGRGPSLTLGGQTENTPAASAGSGPSAGTGSGSSASTGSDSSNSDGSGGTDGSRSGGSDDGATASGLGTGSTSGGSSDGGPTVDSSSASGPGAGSGSDRGPSGGPTSPSGGSTATSSAPSADGGTPISGSGGSGTDGVSGTNGSGDASGHVAGGTDGGGDGGSGAVTTT